MTSITSDYKHNEFEDVIKGCDNLSNGLKTCGNGMEKLDMTGGSGNYVFFTNISFIACKQRSLSWTKAELTHLFHDLPDGFTPVTLAIPTSKYGNFVISSVEEYKTLLSFPFSEMMNFNRGYDQTANYLLITRVINTYLHVTNVPDSNDQFTNSDMAKYNHIQNPTKILKFYAFRSPTVYEASRIVDLLHKIGCDDIPPLIGAPVWQPSKINLRLHLDIKEGDGAGENFVSVPKEKAQLFKLRKDVEKRLFISIGQVDSIIHLPIARLLDVCVGYGRYISDTELTYLGGEENVVLDDTNLVNGSTISTYVNWPLKHPDFVRLNTVSGRDECIFFTVVVNLLINKLEKPLRLRRTCRTRVYRPDEFFWLSFDKNPLVEDYTLTVVEHIDEKGNLYAGNIIDISDVVPSHKDDSPLFLSNSYVVLGDDLHNDDENEPLMSGNGVVSQEVISEQILIDWGQLITNWHAKMKQDLASTNDHIINRTSQSNWTDLLNGGCAGPMITNLGSNLCQKIKKLVIRGVPDALRAEVWQLLAGCPVGESALMDAYRVLVNEPCEYDEVIRRDLARTFPANHFFRDKVGQDSLFHVSRAYALYDSEVGYCQGLTFFAAVLLLHMPVEQTFTLLVEVNNHYGVKDMFLNNLGGLHMRLYQLERLMQDQLPDVFKHFSDLGLEAHMFASQWFLTLFTSKFPLHVVFHIVDLFLTEGMIFIFKIAISLLRLARLELLTLDFEGVLKYLRVAMPKRYLLFEAYVELIETSISAKVTPSKLQKYAKDWIAKRTQESLTKCPINLLECQIASMKKQIDDLSRENQLLAAKLLTSEVQMHERGDRLEDKAEILTRELFISRKDCVDALEEKARLETEVNQVKKMFRALSETNALEVKRSQQVINCYKLILTNLLNCLAANRQSTEDLKIDDKLYLQLTCNLLEQVSTCDKCVNVLKNYFVKYHDCRAVEFSQLLNLVSKIANSDTDNVLITDFIQQFEQTLQHRWTISNRTETELEEDDDTVLVNNNNNNNNNSNNNNNNSNKTVIASNIFNRIQWLNNTLNNLRSLNLTSHSTSFTDDINNNDNNNININNDNNNNIPSQTTPPKVNTTADYTH